jgi:hypothetical protein
VHANAPPLKDSYTRFPHGIRICRTGVVRVVVREHAIDILIMGACSHSPLRSLLVGSKTSDLLRSATIPTLLLR